MRLLLFVLLAVGCLPRVDTSDLRRCDPADPWVDCCSADDECVAYFGESFAFCATPGKETGQCVECTVNEHCELDAYCRTGEPDIGSYCAPLPPADES